MPSLKKVFQLWFVLLVSITVIHQVVDKLLHIHFPLLDSYLDPILLMPILLQLLLWERRILFRKGVQFVFSRLQLFLIFIVVSFIAEYLFPRWNPLFIADIWDVFCYGMGTISFGIFWNKPG